VSVARTLPIKLAPVPGEALDSWLEAIAHRLRTALADLYAVLSAGSSRVQRWIIELDPQQRDRLARATGVADEQLDAMTLSRYHRVGRRRRGGAQISRGPWERATGSRFCPDCLRETGGRWQLTWRLAWSFACVTHQRLLADDCPDCGRAQRCVPHPAGVVPQPGRCARPGSARACSSPGRCAADLSRADTLRLPADHPALAAQQAVLATIERGLGTFGVYRIDPQPACAVLHDIRAIAHRLLQHCTRDDLLEVIPPELVEADNDSPMLRSSNDRPTKRGPGARGAPMRSARSACVITFAVSVMGCLDIQEAGRALRWLIEHRLPGHAGVTPQQEIWGTPTSWQLASVEIAALDPLVGPLERIRLRSPTPMPSLLVPDQANRERRKRSTPTLMWPELAVRLAVPSVNYQSMRAALACAVQMMGSSEALINIERDLATPTLARVERALTVLQRDRHWSDICTALSRIVDYLDSTEAPIDYTRRDGLNYAEILPEPRWHHLCRMAEIRPRREQFTLARCWIFERLSGRPANQAPWAAEAGALRAKLAKFPKLVTPELAVGMDEIASEFLRHHHIGDEPVTWHPPLALLSGLQLPGSAVDAVDIDALHRAIRIRRVSAARAGREFGVTTAAVRYLLERHPAPLESVIRQPKTRAEVGIMPRWRASLGVDGHAPPWVTVHGHAPPWVTEPTALKVVFSESIRRCRSSVTVRRSAFDSGWH